MASVVFARPQESQSRTSSSASSSSTTMGPKESGNVTLLKSDIVPLDAKGSFSYDIELSDGTKLMQAGHTEPPSMGETEPSIVIEG